MFNEKNQRQFRVQWIKLPPPRQLTQYHWMNFELRIPTLSNKRAYSNEFNKVLEVNLGSQKYP